MSLKNEGNLMIDAKLMKNTGLYQLLNPHSLKVFKYLAITQILVLVMLFFMLVLNIYYLLDNLNDVVNYLLQVVACANSIYKLYSIIRYSNTFWNGIQSTSIQYLSYKYHRRQISEIGRIKLKSLTTFFAIWWAVSCSIWIISPLFNYYRLNNEIKNENIGNYQYNVLNLVFPVSVKFYNKHFISYYVLESILMVIWSHSMLIFDIITISMCVTLSYQLKTIVNSYHTFGIAAAAHKQFIGKVRRR